MLHDYEYKRIADCVTTMGIAIMMKRYAAAELEALDILATVQVLSKWEADLLTQKQCQ